MLQIELLEARLPLSITPFDVNLAGDSSEIAIMGAIDDRLIFNRTTDASDSELWSVILGSAPEYLGNFHFIGQSTTSFAGQPVAIETLSNSATVGSDVYFLAFSDEFHSELWKTDGTAAGTSVVATETNMSEPPNGRLVSVDEQLVGLEDGRVWSLDNSETPSTIATFDGRVGNSWEFDQRVFFAVGGAIWSTDGTAEGTALVRDGYGARPASNYPILQVVEANGAYYYPSQNQSAGGMSPAWRFDELSGEVSDFGFEAGQFGSDGESLFFVESGAPNYRGPIWELAPASTTPINLGEVTSPVSFHSNGTDLFVTSIGSSDTRLWSKSTFDRQLVDLGEFDGLSRVSTVFGFVGDTFFFQGFSDDHGLELWSSDGTQAGTGLYEDLFPGPNGSIPSRLSFYNDRAYFVANDFEHGRELRVLEPLAPNSQLVTDASAGNAGSDPRYFSLVEEELWFIAFDEVHGRQLWKSDGTEQGTAVVESIPGITFYAHTDDSLYVSNSTRILKWQNGTSLSLRERTRTISDIASAHDGRILYVEFSDRLYLLNESGDDALILELEAGQRIDGVFPCLDDFCFYISESNARSVWISDGTVAGTTELVRFTTDRFAPSDAPVTAGGYFSFEREDGLWTSDGTPENTQLTAPLDAPTDSISFREATYFTSRFPSDSQLWKTDERSGTVSVRDANAEAISAPHNMIVTGDSLYFAAGSCGDESTCQVWRVTDSGVADLLLEMPVGSDPKHFQEFSGELYFSASSPENGRELWAYSFVNEESRLVADINEGENDGATGSVFATDGGLFVAATLKGLGEELVHYSQDRGWFNAASPANVDWETGVTPVDALLVINELSNRALTDATTGALSAIRLPPHALDVDNDGFVTPVDALLVINALDTSSETAVGNSRSPIAARASVVDRVIANEDDGNDWLLVALDDDFFAQDHTVKIES